MPTREDPDAVEPTPSVRSGGRGRRVVLMAPDAEISHELRTAGWVGLDRLDTTPVPGVPERFDGDAADATALIYFSSGARLPVPLSQ